MARQSDVFNYWPTRTNAYGPIGPCSGTIEISPLLHGKRAKNSEQIPLSNGVFCFDCTAKGRFLYAFLMMKMKMMMKRKELDDVNDEFSDFSLSSPARKIRRLEAELPPIIEEEEKEVQLVFEQLMPEKEELRPLGIEELESVQPVNDERAIVLFDPIKRPISHSNFSFSVHSDIISEFKNKFLHPSSAYPPKVTEEEIFGQDKNKENGNECLAVVPWIPSQFPPTPDMEFSRSGDADLMDADEMGVATMDIEEDCGSIEQMPETESSGMKGNEGLHQWQQQHCMISPQFPQNPITPVMGYR